MTWATLGGRAKTWRVVHASWSVVQLGCLGYIWASALTGRRSPRLWVGVTFLAVEGAALLVGRGNCPVGELQAEWGDPVPFFELVLPPRAAKAAVPVLAVVSVAGIGALLVRSPGLVAHAGPAAQQPPGVCDLRLADAYEPDELVARQVASASRSGRGPCRPKTPQ